MKNVIMLITSLFVIVALTVPALAVEDIQSTNIASKQATSTTTAAVATGLRTQKSIFITGQLADGTMTNYSSVVTIQEAPAAAGPFVTAKDVSGNAVTATHTNTVFHLNSLGTYYRAVIAKTNESALKLVTIILKYAK